MVRSDLERERDHVKPDAPTPDLAGTDDVGGGEVLEAEEPNTPRAETVSEPDPQPRKNKRVASEKQKACLARARAAKAERARAVRKSPSVAIEPAITFHVF